jgi:hypothetical protein
MSYYKEDAMRSVIRKGSWVKVVNESLPIHGFTGRVHGISRQPDGMRLYSLIATAKLPDHYETKDVTLTAWDIEKSERGLVPSFKQVNGFFIPAGV